jgi:ATP-dependent Clp protease ATP-binding subunit ClpC
VVLFDELEKAHPEVMNILLQILEEGKLTDSLGRTIDFRNTVVIMTSNLGADFTAKGGGLGFGGKDEGADYDRMKVKMVEESKRVFKPELLNRIDDVIVFGQLNRGHVLKILDIEVNKVRKRLATKNIEMNLTDGALNYLVDKGYDPAYGARPLRRAVEKYLEDPLAEEILRGNLHDSETVEVTADEDGLKFGQLAGTS